MVPEGAAAQMTDLDLGLDPEQLRRALILAVVWLEILVLVCCLIWPRNDDDDRRR